MARDSSPIDPQRDSFESIYSDAGNDLERVPWARLAPHPELVRWLDHHASTGGAAVPTDCTDSGPQAATERSEFVPFTPALVIACGLGDDAEELARRGFGVTAFDLAATAIAGCRRRFPASTVSYRTADLLDLPASWSRRYSVVVEVNTIQAVPVELRAAAVRAIADTVAPGGWLFVRCAGRADGTEPSPHRPFPLERADLDQFVELGLREVTFEQTSTASGRGQFVATYQRTV